MKLNKTDKSNNNNVFGGIIEPEDFYTNQPNPNRINNQSDANNLSSILEAQNNKRKELEKYKHMTLEELKKMRIISNTDKRPVKDLTDEKWQKEFEIRKLFITPHPKNIKRFGGKFSKSTNGYMTNYQSYCAYINDVLKNIRRGEVDYCYYICQILDLLKFHLDDLRTMYCDGYWMVWLKR